MGRKAAFLLALAVSACGPAGDDAPNQQDLERLSTPQNVAAPPPPAEPIVALTNADVTASPACLFRRGGTALLVWFGDSAVARVNGRAQRFAAAAPVGPEGGFFEAGQVSISIGRGDEGGRLMITDRGNDRQKEYRGEWLCRTQ